MKYKTFKLELPRCTIIATERDYGRNQGSFEVAVFNPNGDIINTATYSNYRDLTAEKLARHLAKTEYNAHYFAVADSED